MKKELVISRVPALEKLRAIPIGKRIKVSECHSIEVKYVIWRTGENEYKIEIKRGNLIVDDDLAEEIWERNEDEKPMPDDFDPACYYYETIEGLTAQQVLEVEPVVIDAEGRKNIVKIVHDIELHELYEIPTENKSISWEEFMKEE